MPRFPALAVIGMLVPPLALAALGLTHPHRLTADTAGYWHTLHLVLLVIFPLLGVQLWWLLAGLKGVSAWLARVLAFVYIVFYSALDVLAGIGTGYTVMRATAEGRPELAETTRWLFTQGNALGSVGVWAFLLACLVTVGALFMRVGWAVVPGGLLLLVSAGSFLNSHIYYPRGVVTMLGFAAGFALLQWALVAGKHATLDSR